MLAEVLILYYMISLIYSIMLFVWRRKGAVLQAMILISFPFLGILLVRTMFKEPNQNGELPEWLLRREKYKDISLQTPDRELETNVIPFQDALMLNENHIKRKTLINLLKEEFLQQSEALALALKSEDSETSHYAATALQQAKSHLMKELRRLEGKRQEEGAELETLKQYADVLKQSVQMEFLDGKTRSKYMQLYSQALSWVLAVDTPDSLFYYNEKISTALELKEFQQALETAEAFLERFPYHEDAYFASMNVHFQMRNDRAFFHLLNALRASSIRLSPERLNQLRYWLQGDLYEQGI